MALSYYSNWESFQQLDSDMAIADPELRALPAPWNYDYLFEPNDLFYSENPNSFLYDFSNGVPFDSINSIATEPFSLHQEFEPLHYAKRPKGCDVEQIYSESDQFNPAAFFNGFVPNPSLLQDYSPPEIVVPPLPDFPNAPPGYATGSCESLKKEPAAGSLSAQSIAARQRRRKITEKTQELGKLVPGGQKMNTAEMLQAAYKYIKYLRAQVGVLEFIRCRHQENVEAQFESSSEELQALLESPLIQEKLYSTENCLVPQEFVEDIGNDHEIVKRNPNLLPSRKKEH